MYDNRADIINEFLNKHIYPGNLEGDVYYTPEELESESSFEESIPEWTKTRRLKKSDAENQKV